ncbi:hypothetical protein SUGI_0989470 [Cryptomeria japonica]|nr:hypothetical protein SUGI_0989470 [Cryptomeria japonica]
MGIIPLHNYGGVEGTFQDLKLVVKHVRNMRPYCQLRQNCHLTLDHDLFSMLFANNKLVKGLTNFSRSRHNPSNLQSNAFNFHFISRVLCTDLFWLPNLEGLCFYDVHRCLLLVYFLFLFPSVCFETTIAPFDSASTT